MRVSSERGQDAEERLLQRRRWYLLGFILFIICLFTRPLDRRTVTPGLSILHLPAAEMVSSQH